MIPETKLAEETQTAPPPTQPSGPATVLITGTRSGIGRATATLLTARGYRVFGTSRNPGPTDEGFPVVKMDVTDADSVDAAIGQVMAEAGRIDVLVNNAGCGIAGAVEDTSVPEALEQFETNFFGVLRVCHAVLPGMRERGTGRIINVSSIGGLIGLPYQGLYSASKFALEAMTEALRMEVRRFGIFVSVVEPGDVKTSFTENRQVAAASDQSSVYHGSFAKTLGIIENDEAGAIDPAVIARSVLKIMRARSPAGRYLAGPVYQRAAAHLRRVLPARVFQWVIETKYGLWPSK